MVIGDFLPSSFGEVFALPGYKYTVFVRIDDFTPELLENVSSGGCGGDYCRGADQRYMENLDEYIREN